MSVGHADAVKAVNEVWDAGGLDVLFKALWSSGVAADEFPVLHEGTLGAAGAGGGQPWPYCVYELAGSTVKTRASGGELNNWEERDFPLTFRVFARRIEGDVRSPKQIAAYLAEEIMKVFGGHPTQASDALTPDNGNHLITTLLSDFALREDEDRYRWTLSYAVKLGVPVTI